MRFQALIAALSVAGAVALMPPPPEAADFPCTKTINPSEATKVMGDETKNIPKFRAPDPKGCAKHELIIARGTGESGPYGAIVGDMLIRKLNYTLKNDVQGYAVNYPASFNVAMAKQGVDDGLRRIQQQAKACPDTTFALVGYSQGAAVMLGVAKKIPADIEPKVKAVVMFGDPALRSGQSWPAAYTSKIYENCNLCDMVCDKKGTFGPHLHYQEDKFQDPSAKFILNAFQGQPIQAKPKVPENASGKCSAKDMEPVTIYVGARGCDEPGAGKAGGAPKGAKAKSS